MNAAREAAKRLIAPYVQRGDLIESLRYSHMASTHPNGMWASIGGYMPVGQRYWSTDWILVARDIDGNIVNQAFKLKDIYDELKQGQQVLL